MTRTITDETQEKIRKAYAEGLTNKEVLQMVREDGIDITYSGVKRYNPKYAKRVNRYVPKWDKNASSARPYAITEEGAGLLNLGIAFSGGFEKTPTIYVLRCLADNEANEYEMVERMRNHGLLDAAKSRTQQLGGIKRKMEAMERNGFIARA